MGRGGRSLTIRTLTRGDLFLPVPLPWAHASKPGDKAYDFDLNSDVAAALLDSNPSSIYRWSTEGRIRADTRERFVLPCWQPHGKGKGKHRYYRLVDLEQFAAEAWVRPRPIRYMIIPNWYIEKHGRIELAPVTKKAPPKVTAGTPLGLPPEEQAAVDRGFPVGCYVEGDMVLSPSGVQVNPGPMDSAELHELARRELDAMRG